MRSLSYKACFNIDGTINPNVIQRMTDNAFIPNDLENRDYQEHQEWKDRSVQNTLLPADTPIDIIIRGAGRE